MTYKLQHQPLVSFKDSKPSYEQLEEEVAELRKLKTVSLDLVDALIISKLEEENAELREFKKNWIEIKTQLAFSVENYEEYEIEIYTQILKEMKKLEGGE